MSALHMVNPSEALVAFAVLLVSSALAYKLYSVSAVRSLQRKVKENGGDKFQVCIIGAGPSGINMAVKLKEAGIPFTIFEMSKEAGGTWLDNTYPGCACDVPGYAYNYSFDLNPDWPQAYVPQKDLLNYFVGTARKFKLYGHIKFGQEVLRCEFYESKQLWLVSRRDIASGAVESDWFNFLVPALGQLNSPKYPDIPGRDVFQGVQFHTSRWNHQVDLNNKVVIGVGTGASAVQAFPTICKENNLEKLTIIMRSPTYFLPKIQAKYSELYKSLLRYIPFLMSLFYYWEIIKKDMGFWFSYGRREMKNNDPKTEFTVGNRIFTALLLRYLSSAVRYYPFESYLKLNSKFKNDIQLNMETEKEKFKQRSENLYKLLKPNFIAGCKRVGISNDFYEMFHRREVEITTKSIARIHEHSVILKDSKTGEEIEQKADVIIWATGFEATTFVNHIDVSVVKKDGSRLDLHKQWGTFPEAYKGTFVPNFPNMAVLFGPLTNLGHNPVIFQVEVQVNYAVRMIQHTLAAQKKSLVVKPEVCKAYTSLVVKKAKTKVFSGSCGNWYKNEDGVNVTNWYGTCLEFWLTLSGNDIDKFFLA